MWLEERGGKRLSDLSLYGILLSGSCEACEMSQLSRWKFNSLFSPTGLLSEWFGGASGAFIVNQLKRSWL
jgi:hypothetical protein